jgi:hypothetical protein
MNMGKCTSWACSAAMAINVTASLLWGNATASTACRALDGNVHCTEKEAALLFGNTRCPPWRASRHF